MKKLISISLALVAVASMVFAQDLTGSFSATGDGASVAIPASSHGYIQDETLNLNVDTNKTLTIYRPRLEGREVLRGNL